MAQSATSETLTVTSHPPIGKFRKTTFNLSLNEPLGHDPRTIPSGEEVRKLSVRALPPAFYDSFLSGKAKNRKPSSIRELLPLELNPGVLSLLAGKPNPFSFPITSATITVRSASDPPGTLGTALTINEKALADGLQYGITSGYGPLVDWLQGLQAYSHGRNHGEGWRISVTSGSQDALFKAFSAVLSPGDSVLVESPVYSGILPILNELEAEIIPIESDAYGLQTSLLRNILDNWPTSKVLPKVLYTVPYGSNPTGITTAEDRRLDVLALATNYNFLIFEDDPYYYLYYGDLPRPRSYFTLELEQPEVGRVIRFDSMSKILSAGMRVGFASGPAPILDSMDMLTAMSNMQASSLSQVITHVVLESWGYHKFRMHTEMVSSAYRKRRDMFDVALRSTLKGLVEWKLPVSGLFFWIRLLINGGNEDSNNIIRENAFKKGVLAMPGAAFIPDDTGSPYVRASFSLLEPNEIHEALKRLKEVLLEAQALQ